MVFNRAYILEKVLEVNQKWEVCNSQHTPTLEKIAEKAMLYGQIQLLDVMMNDILESEK